MLTVYTLLSVIERIKISWKSRLLDLDIKIYIYFYSIEHP